jgi:hypothetical protein
MGVEEHTAPSIETLNAALGNEMQVLVNMKTEKRRLHRFDLEFTVAVSVMDKEGEVLEILEYTIRDISAGGVYLQKRKALPTGTPMEVAFFLPPEMQEQVKIERAHIRVSGMVVRADEGGMGVCFDEKYHMEPL